MKALLQAVVFAILVVPASGLPVWAQGTAKKGAEAPAIRDTDLEQDSLHNLEVARNYFKLKKAYVAALKRSEEIIAGNPNFARIDEVLFIAGECSLSLSQNKGKQNPSLYVIFDGNTKHTLSAEEFRSMARDYLTKLVTEHPQSSFRRQAEEDLRSLNEAKPPEQSKQ